RCWSRGGGCGATAPSLNMKTARWWRGIVLYAPRTGGAYDSHHRTAGIAGCTRRRGVGVVARSRARYQRSASSAADHQANPPAWSWRSVRGYRKPDLSRAKTHPLRFGGRRVTTTDCRDGAELAAAGKERKLPLGPVTALDPGKARSLAKDLLARVRLGEDPLALKHEAAARASETFGAQLPRYLAFKRASLRPRSYAQVERHLMVHAKPLHNRPLASLATDRRGVAIVLANIAE